MRNTDTPSSGVVVAPDRFSGVVEGSIQTCVVKLCFTRALLYLPLVV
jgi:hypothetical protein